MDQQRVTVYPVNQPVQIQAAQPTVAPLLGRHTLLHGKSHKRLGTIQMSIGSLCIIMSAIAMIVGYDPYYILNGIDLNVYNGINIVPGVFYVITGLLGFLAFLHSNRCLVVACMVMNILSTWMTVVALAYTSIEISILFSFSTYEITKCVVLIICFVMEFIVTIVHASFSCGSVCSCCIPREADDLSDEIRRAAAAQSEPHVIVTPGHSYQHGHQRTMIIQQQPGQFASQQVVQNNPQQNFGEGNYQGNVAPPYIAQQDTSHLIKSEVEPYNAIA